jgi:hypothetical protein
LPNEFLEKQNAGGNVPRGNPGQLRELSDHNFCNTTGILDIRFSTPGAKLPALSGVLRVSLIDMLIDGLSVVMEQKTTIFDPIPISQCH